MKNLKFFIDINKNIPKKMYHDSKKIFNVLFNVLINAIKYTNFGIISV